MKAKKVVPVLLAVLLAVGGAPVKATSSTGGDLSDVIADYLGGSADIADVIAGVMGQGGNPCSLSDGSPALGIRKLYDTLMLIGDVLCRVGVTCFTQYARDIFPIPLAPGDLESVFSASSEVVLLGRWYQIYSPLVRLGRTYASSLANRSGGQVEPFAIVLYPDIGVGEGRLQVVVELLNKVGADVNNVLSAMGDRDIVEKLVEVLAEKVEEQVEAVRSGRGGLRFSGDDLWRLLLPDRPLGENRSAIGQAVKSSLKAIAIPWPRMDEGDRGKEQAKEVFFRTMQDAFPGLIIAMGKPGSGQPTRTILIVGSSAPNDVNRLFKVDGLCESQSGDSNGQRWNGRGETYFELAGRIPYTWNTVMEAVLPVAKTVIGFAEEMERREKPFPNGGQGGATAP